MLCQPKVFVFGLVRLGQVRTKHGPFLGQQSFERYRNRTVLVGTFFSSSNQRYINGQERYLNIFVTVHIPFV